MFRSDRRSRGREIQWSAANRRIGHDWAYAIVYGRQMATGGLLLIAAGVGLWAWFRYDLTWPLVVQYATPWLALVGGACVLLWLLWVAFSGGPLQIRLMAATGASRVGRAGHFVGAGGALLLGAAILMRWPL